MQPPPQGGGKRRYSPGIHSAVAVRHFKKTLHRVPEDDRFLCAPRAILAAMQFATEPNRAKRQKLTYRRRWHMMDPSIYQLFRESGLGPGEWGPKELVQVMTAPMMQPYRLAVVDGRRMNAPVCYGRGDTVIAIYYADHHYDALTNLQGFLGKAYLCPLCLKGYNDQGRHRCQDPRAKARHCNACLQNDCQAYREAWLAYRQPDQVCPECRRSFYGPTCFNLHKTRNVAGQQPRDDTRAWCGEVCKVWRKCKHCGALLKGRQQIRNHACGSRQCPSCHKSASMTHHKCYIQVEKPVRQKSKVLYVFFDIEAMQTSQGHVPNLLVCLRDDQTRFYHWFGTDCVREFLLALEQWAQYGEVDVTVLAHNFQGYDSYPVIDKLHELGVHLNQVRNGGKVLELTCFRSVRFIDSISFFQMSLAKFPDTFGLLELKKGYFPHLFNTPYHQTYVGTLPDVEHYMPDSMAPKRRAAFLKWHADLRQQGYVFNFQQELLAYCQSDVQLLKEGCQTFQRDFQERAGFCPFKQMTIASACNRYLRRHCLDPDTIACEPPHGWGGRHTNQSVAAFQWLAWQDHLLRRETEERMTYEECLAEEERARQDPTFEYSWALPRIRHAHNGGEIRPLTDRRYLCDGFDTQTNTVYEFNGCFWHGCPTCFPHRTEPHARLCDLTMDDVYQTHREKVTALRQAGYNVKVQWECQWNSFLRQSVEAQTFLKTHPPHQPLDPRDAFYGGRTNAYQLYYQVQGDDEQIRYYDFKSLYPYVNKYCEYPLGHPVIISQPPLENGLADWFGLARVTIVPPRDLYHPVLPYRHRDKLLFPLCAACVELWSDAPLLQNVVCHHTFDERALTGTWCTPELRLALQKGYTLLRIDQVYHFPQRKTGLFRDYIDTWLKLKEEASGYPSDCVTGEQQRQHCRDWFEREGIVLSHRNIAKNPGQRALSKMMLNSMWGKFGQQENKTQVKEFTEPSDFWHFLDSDQHDIRWISPLDEDRVEVHHKMTPLCETNSPHLNIFIAAFTTCHARLRLYQALDHLQERCLYSDTDSVIFRQSPNDPPMNPALGRFLGDFTDELDPGDYIVEFCSGGPKNYGYRTHRGKVECKVRGFSLDYEGQTQLNFDVLKRNTLAEIYDPQVQPRTTPIVQSHTILREPRRYHLTSAPRTKQYRLVYTKRLLDPDTCLTYPFG